MPRMAHTRGGIASSVNAITPQIIVRRPNNGHVLLVKNIMAEDQFKSLSKSPFTPQLKQVYHLFGRSFPLAN